MLACASVLTPERSALSLLGPMYWVQGTSYARATSDTVGWKRVKD